MKDIIENDIRENFKSYAILALIILLGLIVGIMFVNNMHENHKNEANTYLTEFIVELKNENKINYFELLKKTMINNLEFIIIVVLLNFSIWGGVGNFVLLGYKGFCLGYSISSVISIFGIGKGLIFTLSLILLSEMLYIPTLIFITALSSNTYKELIKTNNGNKRVTIIKYSILLLIIALIAIIISFLQTYLNTNIFLMFTKYF